MVLLKVAMTKSAERKQGHLLSHYTNMITAAALATLISAIRPAPDSRTQKSPRFRGLRRLSRETGSDQLNVGIVLVMPKLPVPVEAEALEKIRVPDPVSKAPP